MHVLVLLIVMTAEYLNIAGASGKCEPLKQIPNTKPVSETVLALGKFRIECADGFLRKAGTSNLMRCMNRTWKNEPPLNCIEDPKAPRAKTERPQHFMPSITERMQTPSIPPTSRTTTGHIAFTSTNEVATTKTRRTTNRPTLKSTTKETESNTTASEVAPSTSSSFTSRVYVSSVSSMSSLPTQSTHFTSKAGIPEVSSSNFSIGNPAEQGPPGQGSSGNYTSIVGGGAVIILILVAAVFLWWKLRHQATNSVNGIQLHESNSPVCISYSSYMAVSPSEDYSAEPNIADAVNKSTTDSVHDTNNVHCEDTTSGLSHTDS